jgi:hypothetical protein
MDPEEYEEDDIPHMRKVAAYCKRHLAQEETAKKDPNSRSARSLKNWGSVKSQNALLIDISNT